MVKQFIKDFDIIKIKKDVLNQNSNKLIPSIKNS